MSRKTAAAEAWSNFVYGKVLDEFRKIVETEYAIAIENRSEQMTGQELALATQSAAKDERLPGRLRAQRKRVVDAMVKVGTLFRAYLDKSVGTGFDSLLLEIESPADSFSTYERTVIARLEKLTPSTDSEEKYIWPGPLTIQQVTSLFVRTCIRIHCERQDLDLQEVANKAAIRIIAPALAYIAYLDAPNGSFIRRRLKMLSEGDDRAEMLKSEENNKQDDLRPETHQELKWHTLLSAIHRVIEISGRPHLGLGDDEDSAERPDIDAQFQEDFFKETHELYTEHVKDPHGGRLWQCLGMLSNTSPASADTLLFQILRDLGEKQPAASAGETRIVCPRMRYEAVRNAVYDEKLRCGIQGSLPEVRQIVADELARTNNDSRLLQIAFLVSRRALLPMDYRYKHAGDMDEHDISNEVEFSHLANNMLTKLSASDNLTTKRIASRYRIGLISNPRFAKNPKLMAELGQAMESFMLIGTNGRQTVLTDLFAGRMAWLELINNPKLGPRNTHRHYSSAANRLFRTQHYFSTVDNPGNWPRTEEVDSEAPVWLLPELATLIKIGPAVTNASEYQGSTSDENSDKKSKQRVAVATTLLRIGERQFGIYINHRAEDTRIRQGLLLSAEMLRRSRKAV